MGKKSKNPKSADQRFESPMSDEAIREQLGRILGHAEFRATGKMRDFLRYVVEETLAGRSERIKGFSIATEVYGRDADFDAAHDPVVRIQAGRLRRAIERYYLVGGRQDLIRIDIPVGGYIPVFVEGPGLKATPNQGQSLPKQNSLADSSPVVLIVPFEDFTGKPEHAYLGIGLATELSIQLGHCADLRVMQYREGALSKGKLDLQPDFTIKGSVFCDDTNMKVVAQLFNSKTDEQLWIDSLKSPFESAHLLDFQERAANSICAHLAGEHGAIVRLMTVENSLRSTPHLTTYQAVLKGYSYWER
jgi:adenylate cyclase